MQQIDTHRNQLHMEKLLRVVLSLKDGRIRMSRIMERSFLGGEVTITKGQRPLHFGQVCRDNSVSLMLKDFEGH